MEDEEDAPVKTAEERGLTIETFQNKPLKGDKALLAKVSLREGRREECGGAQADLCFPPRLPSPLQLKPLVKDWDGVKNKIEQSMEHLQDTASSLSEAGLFEDEVSSSDSLPPFL